MGEHVSVMKAFLGEVWDLYSSAVKSNESPNQVLESLRSTLKNRDSFFGAFNELERSLSYMNRSSPEIKDFRKRLHDDVISTVQKKTGKLAEELDFGDVLAKIVAHARECQTAFPKHPNISELNKQVLDLQVFYCGLRSEEQDFIDNSYRRANYYPIERMGHLVYQELEETYKASEFLNRQAQSGKFIIS